MFIKSAGDSSDELRRTQTTKENMKKYSIFLMAALALGFTACDDKSDLGIAQVNPQEPVASAEGVTVAASDAYKGTIDLENNVNKKISIVSIAETVDFPEGTKFDMKLAVAKDETMAGAQTLPIVNGQINANDLEDIIVEYYNITPEVVTPWMGIEVYANVGDQQSRLGGDNFYYLKQQVNVLPVDAKLDIENSYFLGGTLSQKMEHSPLHAYVDNNFIAIFEVSADQAAAGFKWNIVPGSVEGNATPAECYGPSGSNTLALGGEGTITAPGRYRLVANMLEKTYTLTFAYEILYTPGTGNDWSQVASMQLYTVDYATYFGFTRTGEEGAESGKFKLCATENWDMNWGLNDGVLTKNGGDIETVPAGFWWVKANLNDLSLALLHVEKISIIGLNGDWDNDIFLTPSADMLTWTGEMTANDATNFKFRINGGWDANLGGTADKLVMDGANIDIAAGTYAVTLDLSKVPYTCTLTAK